MAGRNAGKCRRPANRATRNCSDRSFDPCRIDEKGCERRSPRSHSICNYPSSDCNPKAPPADPSKLTYRRSEHRGSECFRLPDANHEPALRMIRASLTPDFLASTILTPGTLRSSTKLAAGRDQVIGSIARQHALQAHLGNVRVSVRRSWFAGVSPARSAGSLTGVAGLDAAPRSRVSPVGRELALLTLIGTAGIMLDAGLVGTHGSFDHALEVRPLQLARLGDFSEGQG